jgi:AraC-like DNA-binding protein
VTPRLEHIILKVVTRGREHLPEWFEQEQLSLAVLREELRDSGIPPLPITVPASSRLQPVLDALLEKPALERSLADWSAIIGLSPSSLSRACHRDTGVSFGKWCQRVRLVHALCRLAVGTPVAAVARELGYGPSAFIQMFRKTLGTTPSRYFAW